jgi:hypothetical protein
MTRTVERVERGYRVVERVEPRYEVEEVPYGKVYRWFPGRLVIECGCGEELILPGSKWCSGCGDDYADIPWELMVEEPKSRGEPKRYAPWLAEYREWLRETAGLARGEYHYWAELREI